MSRSNHPGVYLKYIYFLFVSHTSVKLGKKYGEEKEEIVDVHKSVYIFR